MKSINQVLLLLLCALLLSCSDKDESPSPSQQAVDYTDNLFGMSFEHLPVKNGSELEKQIAQAVVYIDTGDYNFGTGTFISSDGRILTNEHVLPRGTCADGEICKNVKVIRGMYPGGPIEVFDKVRVLAHRTEWADAAILQVETNGQTVPYLQLAADDEVKKFREELGADGVVIIGHPFGGTARISRSKVFDLDYDYDGQIRLLTTAISGNSGSAIVNATTGKVIGLYDSSNWDKGTVELTSGRTRRYGSGSDLTVVRESLGIKDLVAGRSSVKAKPLSHNEIISDPVQGTFTNRSMVSTLAIQYAKEAYTKEERLAVLAKFVVYAKEIEKPQRLVLNLLGNITNIYRFFPTRPVVDKLELQTVLGSLAPEAFGEDLNRKWRIHSLLGTKSDRLACLEKYKESNYNKPMSNCFSDKNLKGESVVSGFSSSIYEYLTTTTDTLTVDDINTFRANILWILMHGRPTNDELKRLSQSASKLMTMTKNAAEVYGLETLILAMEEKPDLFQAWQATE